jgi:hypothetical protein
MKHLEVYPAKTALTVFILFFMLISGGLAAAEAADSKATFTVQ